MDFEVEAKSQSTKPISSSITPAKPLAERSWVLFTGGQVFCSLFRSSACWIASGRALKGFIDQLYQVWRGLHSLQMSMNHVTLQGQRFRQLDLVVIKKTVIGNNDDWNGISQRIEY